VDRLFFIGIFYIYIHGGLFCVSLVSLYTRIYIQLSIHVYIYIFICICLYEVKQMADLRVSINGSRED